MKKYLIITSLIIVFTLLLLPLRKISAAPANNPVFATIQYVDQKIQHLLNVFNQHESQNQTDLAFLKFRVEGLEGRVEYLESLLSVTPTPIQTTIFTDNFDDGIFDGWEIIGSDKVHSDLGTWRIENGELIEDGGGDGYMALVNNLELPQQTIESNMKFKHPAGYGGFVVWFENYENLVFIRVYPGAEGIWVEEHVSGVNNSTVYPNSVIQNNLAWYSVKSAINSSTGDIDVYVNNNKIITHHVSTNNRSGRTGLMTGNSGTYFDDFQLTY